MSASTHEYIAEQLAEADLLTRPQASAYLLREVVGLRRPEAAREQGVATSTHDSHYSTAKEKVASARETLALLDALDGHEASDVDLPDPFTE